MKLISTRDSNKKEVSYGQSVLAGLAPDGGLYYPHDLPKLNAGAIKELSKGTYIQITAKLKYLFAAESFSEKELTEIMSRAYSTDKFPHVSEGGNITPVRQVKNDIYLQNLSLGPTAAFKDMALQPLGQEMSFLLKKDKTHLRILGATSGDTGSAAESALKGLPNITLFMLSPKRGMSEFQRAQMGNLSGGNIINISVDGRFDDCQDLVKELKSDREFADLGAVNSINWSRISSQVAYYFSGYTQVAEKYGDPIDFVVPSGNFGNVLAGYIAKEMGLPIRKLIVATNENRVLHDLIQTGVYSIRPAQITTSPSMDISKASNFERVLYDILGKNPVSVSKYMKTFADKGRVSFKDFDVDNAAMLQRGFGSGVSTQSDRLKSIAWVRDVCGEVIDPHTADAITVAARLPEDGVPKVCMQTALSVKFESTVQQAIGEVPQREDRFKHIEERLGDEGAFISIAANPEELKDIIREYS